jgi:hypothetical protein
MPGWVVEQALQGEQVACAGKASFTSQAFFFSRAAAAQRAPKSHATMCYKGSAQIPAIWSTGLGTSWDACAAARSQRAADTLVAGHRAAHRKAYPPVS